MRAPKDTTTRRLFLGKTAGTLGGALAAPALRLLQAEAPRDGLIRVGMIADVHQDVMPDGVARMQAFVAAMQSAGAHAIVNLGDFCVPHARNADFLAAWNTFAGPRIHVLGNHDTDGGYKRETTVEWWGSPGRFHASDVEGLHVVALDGNDPDGKPGYPCSVNDAQLEWLERDLAATSRPTVILIHQPIDAFDRHVRTAAKVRAVLAKANAAAGFRKVLAVFAGHAHLDYVKESDGIPHVQVNSASYYWVGPKKQHANYDAAIQKSHPQVANTCPYRDPLWALVTFDCAAGRIVIDGRETDWVGSDPWELGVPEDNQATSREVCRPAITGRMLGG